MSLNTDINRRVGWSIALSALMIVAGILAVLVPSVSGLAVTILLGWLLVLSGAAHLAYSWYSRHGGGFVLGVLVAIVYVVAGSYVMAHPVVGLKSLTIIVAACFSLGSILEIGLSFRLRPLHGSGWLLFDGIVAFFFAILIWRTWPTCSLWLVGTLVGINIFFSGFARLNISLAARHVMAHRPDSGL